MNAYERLLKARSKDRATFTNFLNAIFDNFYEFHGDRRFGDDPRRNWRRGVFGRFAP